MTKNLESLTVARRISRFRLAGANPVWVIFFGALLGSASAAHSTTLSFQDGTGAGPYTGQTDRQIYDGTPNDGYTRDHLDLAETGSASSRDLIRFDLSNVPSNALVNGATLTLYVLSEAGEKANSLFVLDPAEPWTITGSSSGPASWNDRQASTAWTGGPGLMAGTDYSTPAIANAVTPTNGQFMTFTLNGAGLAAIQDWIDTPTDNSGVFMRQDNTSSDNSTQFAAALNATTADRPLLTLDVTFVPEPTSCMMFGLGAGSLFLTAIRRRRT